MIDIYKILEANSKSLKDRFFNQEFDTIPLIIYCVDKTTIRAFHYSKGHSLKYKPLSIFRVWALSYLSDAKTIDSLVQKGDYQTVRRQALKGLMKFWKNVDGGQPEFYQFNKLIDLFFKCLPLWTELDKKTKVWIFANANVPLDKYSLGLLRISSVKKSTIPRNVSMNYVDQKKYKSIQKEIKEMCREIPPIIFDLYAWDNKSKTYAETFKLIPISSNKISGDF